jgi:hypothetical protein
MAYAGRVHAVILTTQRTGSSSLVECLASHPHIECAREILEGQPDDLSHVYRGPFRRVAKLYRILRTGAWRPTHRIESYFAGGSAKVRMFKVMYNRLERPFALKYLLEHDDVRIIHLRRLNLLKVYVSALLMPKRRELQATAPVEPIRTYVDPARAIESMRQTIARYELYEKIFGRHPRITVAYESLFDGQELQPETGRRICEFLGVEPRPMRSTLVKVNPESLRDIVTNCDELFAALAKTEFAATVERVPAVTSTAAAKALGV